MPPTDTSVLVTADTSSPLQCGDVYSDQCIYRESGDCLDPVYRTHNGTVSLEFHLDAIANRWGVDTGAAYFCGSATARSCIVPDRVVVAQFTPDFGDEIATIHDENGVEVAWLWECNESCPPGPCVSVFFGEPALEDCARKAMREVRERYTSGECAGFVASEDECPENCVQIDTGL